MIGISLQSLSLFSNSSFGWEEAGYSRRMSRTETGISFVLIQSMKLSNCLKINKNAFAVTLTIVGCAVLLLIARKPENPTLRQPYNVGAVQTLSNSFHIKNNMQGAKKTAEKLDRQVSYLVQVQFMSSWSRWRQGIQIDDLQEQYSRDLTTHLKSMAKLLKYRREGGGHLKKLHEFEFQNLVRKSDYLLALPMTKLSFQHMDKRSEWQTAVEKYNAERVIFDSKKIVVANN